MSESARNIQTLWNNQLFSPGTGINILEKTGGIIDAQCPSIFGTETYRSYSYKFVIE